MVTKLVTAIAAFVGLQLLGELVLFELLWMSLPSSAAPILWWGWVGLQFLLVIGIARLTLRCLLPSRVDGSAPRVHRDTSDLPRVRRDVAARVDARQGALPGLRGARAGHRALTPPLASAASSSAS